MADEQAVPIYLSPEEELTSVRERLEQTQARQIILVIPPQTQLRSHVGWRLIHARMRELGKDLLVISPDRQVRAVARAAGFRVAESQESSSTRPRTGSGSRSGNVTTRGSARPRVSSNRGAPDSHAPRPSRSGPRQTPGVGNRSLTPLPPPERDVYEEDEEATLERLGPPTTEPEESQPRAPLPTLFKEPEAPGRLLRDINISTTPSVRPSVPGRLDEEENAEDAEVDKYYNDYHTARMIRESAGASGRSEPNKQDDFPEEREQESHATTPRTWGHGHDPFVYMEDEQQPPRLPEQKGSMSMPGTLDEIGTNVPDISDRSTEIMENEIEDLGDMGALTPPEIASLPKPPTPLHEPGERPRRPSGQMRAHSPRSPRPDASDLDDDDELPAIPDRPTLVARPSKGLSDAPRHPSQSLRPGAAPQTSQRPSQSLRPGQPPQTSQRPSQSLKPGAAPQTSQRARPASARPRVPVMSQSTPTPGQRNTPQRPARRSNRLPAAIFTCVVLLLVILGLLFYFIPTASVTISLQARNYTQNVQLHATVNPLPGTPGSTQAEMLEHDFSQSGQGTASGQTRVGNSKASGLVTFTNNGANNVTIPTGTMIATQTGIPFVTDAEALVAHGSSQPAVPISAQQTGVAGNVPTNSITSIPTSSLASIAQYNHTSAQTIILTVTNTQATSGGGAQNEPAVTEQDIQMLEHTLHQSLQQQITSWLDTQLQPGDLHGTLMPDVPKSANPLPQEVLTGVPPVNQAESGGVFTGTLSVHIQVLVARAAAIKAAAGTLLNTDAQKLHPASMLAAQLPVTLANEKGTSSQDGLTLTISAKATAAIIQQLSSQDISASLAGKSVGQATSDLRTSLFQAGVGNIQISVTPSFLGILPFQASRIHVVFQPTQQTPEKNVPNG